MKPNSPCWRKLQCIIFLRAPNVMGRKTGVRTIMMLPGLNIFDIFLGRVCIVVITPVS